MKKTLLLALMITGCGTGDPMIFYKSDMTRQTYQKDSYECEKDARQSRYGKYESAIDFAVRCMEAKGYRYTQASVLTPETVQRIKAQWNDQK